MIRLLLALVAVNAAAMEFGVDQPDRWWDPMTSHHYLHGAGGVVLGASAYGLAALATPSRPWRYAAAAAVGASVGYGYELHHGRHDGGLVDPVDAAWVAAGAMVGAATVDLIGVAIAPRPDGMALAWACRW